MTNIEFIFYSETLDNLVIVLSRTNKYYKSLKLVSEFGEDPLTPESLDKLTKNLKLSFIAMEQMCD